MSEQAKVPYSEEFLIGLAAMLGEHLVRRFKDEGLMRDERPPMTLDDAAIRLGVSRRTIGDMTRGVNGKPPVLATIKVGVDPDSHKGIRVEPAEIDRYLEHARRESLYALAREAAGGPPDGS